MDENDLRRVQAALTALSKHPSWEDFVAAAEEKAEKLKEKALRIALNPDGADQRRLDEIRGFLGGLDWIVKTPQVAESSLTRFMQKLEREGARHG